MLIMYYRLPYNAKLTLFALKKLYEEGEHVVVESKNGKLLWDAKVVGLSKYKGGKSNVYRVTYDGWSSRFDDWVSADRVVEPNDNNLRVQVSFILFVKNKIVSTAKVLTN